MSVKNYEILLIGNSKAITGALKSIIAVSEHISSQIHYQFVLPSKSIVGQLKDQGYSAHCIPFLEIQKNWRLLLYLPLLVINTIRVIRLINKKQIDILHVNDLYNMVGVMVKLIRPKTKLVYHVRLMPDSYAGFLYPLWSKIISKHSDKIICVSDAVFRGLPHAKNKIVIYDALPASESLSIKKWKPFTFLNVSNYVKGKGQNYVIEAYKLAYDKLMDSRLVMVGGDMGQRKNKIYKNQLIERVISYGLEHNVVFQDFTNDTRNLYQAAEVVLNFSESESFSMVCLESLLNGTPVIGTRCGGPEEIIEDGINGILVENRNIDDMAHAMVTIYQNEELRNSMSQKTKHTAGKFSIENSTKKLTHIYLELC